jgi:beta-N-acetylhexosaminidase
MLGPVVVDLEGVRLTVAERERLAHPLVGMVILFARNFAAPEQLLALTQEIRALRAPPLLIGVDHEGGRVQRFRAAPFTLIPPMAALGALWDRDVLRACRTATSAGLVMAAELRAFGIDLTFAPVLDLEWHRSSVIGDRALHTDHRVVTLLAQQLCHGFALAGMAGCGKHFPGHGWPAADSHVDVPFDRRRRRQILAADAAPYAWLGVSLGSVMPAHVIYPQVDALPAGFSRIWIEEILRGELGFTGAVFSDDLSMEGAKSAGGPVERAAAALAAGCDFALVCNDAGAADAVLSGLQWERSSAFEQRLARLRPLGDAPSIDDLQRDPRYRAARRDVEVWRAELAG